MHDREGSHLVPGWCLITEDVWAKLGDDYTGVVMPIVRLNHGYHPKGTIPPVAYYDDFARQVGQFVAHSKGCRHWVIGNEPNLARERPQGVPIRPAQYAACFTKCRLAIKAVQPDAVVIPAPVGPWNVETVYPENPTGDWVTYFQQVLSVECDGIAIHTYGDHSRSYMNAPWSHRRYGFWSYRDFMEAIPPDKRHLPVFITECNPNRPWTAGDWMQRAADEIHEWNRTGQPIHCLCAYCYIPRDEYHLEGKAEALWDIQLAYEKGYTPMAFAPGRWPHFTGDDFLRYVRGLQWFDPRPNRLFLHHTWKPTKETWNGMATMDAMHRTYRTHVWYDAAGVQHVGWTVFPHIFVAEDGIWLMNDLRVDGAGVTGHNHRSIHVEMVGNYDLELPSGQTWESTKLVLTALMETLGIAEVEFHRDFAAKTCPGSRVTKEWVRGELFPSTGTLPEHEQGEPDVLAEKARWWLEEMQREHEHGHLERAEEIRLSLIRLLYRLEDTLKG